MVLAASKLLCSLGVFGHAPVAVLFAHGYVQHSPYSSSKRPASGSNYQLHAELLGFLGHQLNQPQLLLGEVGGTDGLFIAHDFQAGGGI